MALPADEKRFRKGFPYPSPYMDIAGTWYPQTIKDLFRWCKYYFYTNPIVQSIIYKIAEYPITDFIYELSESSSGEDLNQDAKHRIKDLYENSLDLKTFLINVGLDYFTYGNAFVSISSPFKRFLGCPNCDSKYPIEDTKYTLKAFKFVISCPKCNATGLVAKVTDVPVNDPSGVNLVRWNPENIQIDYNPITGKSAYYYRIPNKVRNDIIRGKRAVIDEMPIKILQALQERRDLQLDNNNLFHYKRCTLAEEDMGWGKPLVLSIMKDIFYLQTLRKSQEAIALQHIVPLDILFPAQNGSVDPYTHIDLNRWRNKIEEEIRKWKADPNYISIMPIPVGLSRLGGDGRMLLITPEIDSVLKNIAAGLGVPLEFIFGGLTWSAGSITLRSMENHFLTTRQIHHRFLNWVTDRIRIPFGLPKSLVCKMIEFKMADDVQQKQLVVNLNAANKISDETMLDEMGYDYEKERDRISQQVDVSLETQKKSAIAQATAQGEASKIQSNYQVQVQEEQQKRMEENQRKSSGAAIMSSQQSANMQSQNIQTPQPLVPPVDAAEAVPMNVMDKNQGFAPMEADWNMEAKTIVDKAGTLPPEQRKEFLARIKKEMPELHEIVQSVIKGQPIERGIKQVDMRPLPEIRPPRRSGAA